jgi:hypothetical protein
LGEAQEPEVLSIPGGTRQGPTSEGLLKNLSDRAKGSASVDADDEAIHSENVGNKGNLWNPKMRK